MAFGTRQRDEGVLPRKHVFLYVPDYNQNVVHIVSTVDNTLVGDVPVGINPHMVAFGGSCKYAYVTNEAGSDISVIDTQTRETIKTISVGQTPVGIAASPDSETIYVADLSTAEVIYISVKSQSVIATVTLPSDPYALAVAPDGKYIYVAGEFPTGGYAIAVASKSVVGTFPIGTQPRNIAVTPDGGTIYETNFDSSDLYAVNAHTFQLEYVKTLGNLDGVAFSATAKPLIENYGFKTLDYPGAVKTEVHQINENGYAVGFYVDKTTVQHGFLYYKGEFVNYDFPGANSTLLNDINSSNLAVGSFVYPSGGRRRLPTLGWCWRHHQSES
jgi:YVTN family beta-propeller protein